MMRQSRRLRIRVMKEAEEHGGVIMVTSSIPGEGKTTHSG